VLHFNTVVMCFSFVSVSLCFSSTLHVCLLILISLSRSIAAAFGFLAGHVLLSYCSPYLLRASMIVSMRWWSTNVQKICVYPMRVARIDLFHLQAACRTGRPVLCLVFKYLFYYNVFRFIGACLLLLC